MSKKKHRLDKLLISNKGKYNNNMPEDQTNIEPLRFRHIKMASQIIEVAAERGAFKAEELSDVGEVYDEISRFIHSVEQSQPEENQEDNS